MKILPIELDDADRRILAAIQRDADQSTAELAAEVGLSQAPCWRRLQRLKNSGVIRGQVALLDREALGLQVQIFAQVKLSAHGRANVTEFTHAVRRWPEVLECHITLGSMDCLLRVVAASMAAYEDFFFNRLSSLPGVQEVNSVVSLTEVKHTTALPVA
jgi:Lrp/AsnC family transcriptional regulator